MQDYRKDEIIYDENWQSFETPDCYKVQTEDSSSDANGDKAIKKPKVKKHVHIALITIQLIVCFIIAFLVFILKAMDTDSFKQLKNWYDKAMSNIIVSNDAFEDIDLSEYFVSTNDEHIASNDEA